MSRKNFPFFKSYWHLGGLLLVIMILGGTSVGLAKPEGTIEVTGQGMVLVKPNLVSLSIVVEGNARTAEAAVKDAAQRMEKIIEKIKSIISSEDKISTTAYQLIPIYDYQQERKRNEITGYRCVNQILVETHNLEALGILIDTATRLGADRIEDLQFTNDRMEEYIREALIRAARQAREIAELVSKALEVKITRITKIFPSPVPPGPSGNTLRMEMAKGVEAAQMSTPIEIGDIQVEATVQVGFEFEQATAQAGFE